MTFANAISFKPLAEAPRLAADGVVLCAHKLEDFDAFWSFYKTDRSKFMGAPNNTTHLWYGLGSEIASWPLRGFGAWRIEADGALAGQIAITQPPHFPEIELGWTLFDGFEGKGLAYSAAKLALNWFWSATDRQTLVSYITPENDRSIALAKRLGAEHDPAAKLPMGETAEETVIYRHRRPL